MTLLRASWSRGDTGHVAEHNLIGAKLNRVVNIYDYGATGNGVANDSPALQAAVNALAAASGGTVYMPAATYNIGTHIDWESRVSLVGDGIGSTKLIFADGVQFLYSGSVGSELVDCTFRDFEIDGSAQTSWQKGFFFLYCKRLFWQRVYVHDTGATGFGSDYMVDCVYDSCIAEGCGRVYEIDTPGCSGFGIGMGKYEVESVSLVNCIARGNKRYGAFFEVQGEPGVNAYFSRGCSVIGGYYETNQWGIGDCGVDGLQIIGAHVNSNLDSGIFVGGPSLGNYNGRKGVIGHCEVASNGADGIEFAVTKPILSYLVQGNQVYSNVGAGITAPVEVTQANNLVFDNGA